MSLCYLCSGLTFSNLYPPNFYRHADDLAALEASATGCRLCRMLRGVLNYPNDNSLNPQLYFGDATDQFVTSPEGSKGFKASVKLQIIPGRWLRWHPKMKGASYVGIWTKWKRAVACMILSVEEGTEACCSIRHCLITFSRRQVGLRAHSARQRILLRFRSCSTKRLAFPGVFRCPQALVGQL